MRQKNRSIRRISNTAVPAVLATLETDSFGIHIFGFLYRSHGRDARVTGYRSVPFTISFACSFPVR
jgi:hypothetical protein